MRVTSKPDIMALPCAPSGTLWTNKQRQKTWHWTLGVLCGNLPIFQDTGPCSYIEHKYSALRTASSRED